MNTITELTVGQVIGKYRVVRELGRGGMGIVYLATDLSLGRNVALKLLHPALSLSENFVQRFKQEARAIAALSHPNIVDIHSLDLVDGRLLIDVRYLEGGSLANRSSIQVMTLTELVRWSSEILSALSQCHSAAIIHRDVKPSNILFDSASRAFLSDFGLAKAYTSHVESSIASASSSGFFLGSPRYAPLEAWTDSEPDPRWDVYSLGIVIYEAIAGAAPYSGATPLSILNQIMNKSVPPLESVCGGVSPALSRLVDDMVHRDPKQRPRDGADALERLYETPEYETSQHRGECTVVIPHPTTPSSDKLPSSVSSARSPYRHTATESAAREAAAANATYPAPVKPRMGRRTLLGLTGILIVLGAVGVVVYRQDIWREPEPTAASASIPAGSARPVSQANHPFPSVPAVADLLMLPKQTSSTRFSIYEVTFPESGNRPSQSWFIGDSGAGAANTVYAIGPSFLARLSMDSADGAVFRLQGDWAEYLDSASSVLRYGTVTGQGRWLQDHAVFTASMQFNSLQDGATWERVMAGSRNSAEATDTRLCVVLEEQPNLQALLYNELLPRNVQWAKDVELLMPAMRNARVEVPAVAGALASFKADGRLDESLWATLANDSGTIQGWPADRSPRMLVRRSEQGVFVAVQAHNTSSAKMTFEIAVMQDYYVPIQDAPVWTASLSPSQEPALSRRTRDRSDPVECTWKTGVVTDGAIATAEAFVPFDSIAKSDTVRAGDRWRLNARLSSVRGDGSAATEVIWGYPEFDKVFHGVILVFGDGASNKHE